MFWWLQHLTKPGISPVLNLIIYASEIGINIRLFVDAVIHLRLDIYIKMEIKIYLFFTKWIPKISGGPEQLQICFVLRR